MMNEQPYLELERQLASGARLDAPGELRGRVLADVSRELRAAKWDRRLARFAAVLLVVGVGINAATVVAPGGNGRPASQPAAHASVVQTAVEVARATDAETGRKVARQLAVFSGESVSEKQLAELDAAIAAALYRRNGG